MRDVGAARADEPKTLNRILANALEHFSNFGYTGASVREITQSANVTKPTLYYYFKNKEELYKGLATSCSEKILTRLTEASEISGMWPSRFINLVRAQNQLCDEDFAVVKFMYLAGVTPSRHVPEVGIKNFNTRLSNLIQRIADDAVTKGELVASHVACVTLVLQGLFQMNLAGKLTGALISEKSLEEALHCISIGK